MSGQRLVAVGAAAVLAALGLGWAIGKWRIGSVPAADPVAPATSTASRGAMLFQFHCASCHGADGRGDGPAAADLRPAPRDFAVRPWRFDVSRDSIRKVTLDGIAGTAMPASRLALAAADVEPLVDHVMQLATARPAIAVELSVEERLLADSGFVDLRGTLPPTLKVSDAAGEVLPLSALKGKLVVVSFWGTSCVHCLNEMPRLRELEAALAHRPLKVLYVCADADDAAAAQSLATKIAPGVRAFVDDTGVGLARFEVQTLPTVWLIGADGKAIGRSHGSKDWHSPALRKLIEHWLPAQP